MKLPDESTLNMFWSVATSSAIESGTRPHIIFAKLLYSRLTNEKPTVGLYYEPQRKESTSEET
jgi:hypothetical protein